MRNKILVLVLALVCLLSVSAMAESKGEANTVLQAHQMRVIESNYEALVKAGHELALDGASDDRYYAYEGKAVVVVEPKDCEDKTGYAQFICNKTCTKKHDADLWENGWPVTKVSLSADLHTIGASNKDLVEKKANSCLTNGYEIWECTECGDQFKITEKNYQDYMAQPGCTYLKDVIPMTGHVKGAETYVKPTCEKKGAWVVKCEDCEVVLSERIDVTSKLADCTWNEVKYLETVPTCLQAGKEVFVRACTVCGKSDTSATTGSYEKDLPQIKHDSKTDAANNLSMLFSVNDKGGKGYYEVITPAKVDANGLRYVDIKVWDPAVTTIEASYDMEGVKGDKLVTKAGVYTYEFVEPKCGVDGSVTITCENCDTSLKYAVKAEEHYFLFDNIDLLWGEIDDCTKSPVAVFKCVLCDYVKKENIPANVAHEYDKHVDGYLQYQDNGRTKLYFEKNEHNKLVLRAVNDNWEVAPDAYTFADCAPYYEVHHCENRTPEMDVFFREGEHGERLEWYENWSHHCNEWKLVEVTTTTQKHTTPAADKFYTKVDATCAKPGLYIYECTVCGDVVEEAPKATGNHKVTTWTTVEEAKCGVAGSKTGKCDVCNGEQTKVLPALEHKYVEDAKLAIAVSTCVDGKTVKVCEYCGDKQETIIPAMHGYSKDAHLTYKEFKASDCKEVGYAIFDCAECKREVKVNLEKVPHTMAIVKGADGKIVYHDATCCTGKFYETKCGICNAVEAVYVGEALGHAAELSKEKMAAIMADLADNRKADDPTVVVMGALTCTEGANAKKICNEEYYVYKNGKATKKNCTHEYEFVIPALGHAFETVKNPVTGEMERICWVCETKEEIVLDKPEYEVKLDGTKGTVKLINKTAAGLKQAWVRISYGFELADGSSIAMVTCMPISFNQEGTVGTFSFFALDTALTSTGMNIMVVDQYDAMFKTVGQLVGNNYGLYVA